MGIILFYLYLAGGIYFFMQCMATAEDETDRIVAGAIGFPLALVWPVSLAGIMMAARALS